MKKETIELYKREVKQLIDIDMKIKKLQDIREPIANRVRVNRHRYNKISNKFALQE